MDELLLADVSVSVFVHLVENLFYLVVGFVWTVEEGFDLLDGNVAGMVGVQIVEGVLQTLLF